MGRRERAVLERLGRGESLAGLELNRLDLSGAALEAGDLHWAKLEGAVFEEARLSGVNLSGASLRGARFGRAELCRVDLSGADLSGADLGRAAINDCNLDGATLLEVQAAGVTVSGGSCRNAGFKSANLEQASLKGVDLSGADLSSALLAGARLDGVRLARCALRDADLSRVAISGADLSGADLSGADLSGASFAAASLADTLVRKTSFKGVSGLDQATLDFLAASGAQVQEPWHLARLLWRHKVKAAATAAVLATAVFVVVKRLGENPRFWSREQIFARVGDHIQHGDPSQALDLLDHVIKTSQRPKTAAEARVLSADLLLRDGETEKARQLLQEVLAAQAANAQAGNATQQGDQLNRARMRLGDSLMQEGKIVEAAVYYRQIVDTTPMEDSTCRKAYLRLAKAYTRAGQPAAAEEMLKRLIGETGTGGAATAAPAADGGKDTAPGTEQAGQEPGGERRPIEPDVALALARALADQRRFGEAVDRYSAVVESPEAKEGTLCKTVQEMLKLYPGLGEFQTAASRVLVQALDRLRGTRCGEGLRARFEKLAAR